MPSPGPPHVKRRNVARPHHAHQKNNQGRPVALFSKQRNGREGHSGIDQAENGGRGVRKHTLHGRTEGANHQQRQGQDAENRIRLMEPFQVVRKQPRDKESQDRYRHSDPRGVGAALLRQAQIFPAGQNCHPGGYQGQQPDRPEKRHNQDQRNQYGSGKNSFHSNAEDTPLGWVGLKLIAFNWRKTESIQ